MTATRGDSISGSRAEGTATTTSSVVPLALSAVVSALLLIQPVSVLIGFWFAQVDTWLRPGLPYPAMDGQSRFLGLTAMCAATVVLHWAAAVRWPRSWARRMSALGLVAALVAAWISN